MRSHQILSDWKGAWAIGDVNHSGLPLGDSRILIQCGDLVPDGIGTEAQRGRANLSALGFGAHENVLQRNRKRFMHFVGKIHESDNCSDFHHFCLAKKAA